MNPLVKRSFLDALATAVYVLMVVALMQNAERLFGPDENFLAPVSFLMLFILSATITGGLILGKPILMFLGGSKAEAVKLFLYTVGWLALMTVVLLLVNFINR